MAGETWGHASYGALGLPLAFVALPLYVLVPAHYAGTLGVSLSAVGALLLISRLLDAFIDPALGRWADRMLLQSGQQSRQAWWVMTGLAALCVLGFWAIFLPGVSDATALLWWCGASVSVTTVAYSACTILHQAWGSQLGSRSGGDAAQRAPWVAWREGLGMLGVVLANVLAAQWGPKLLAVSLSVSMCVALIALRQAPWQPVALSRSNWTQGGISPWRHPAFRRLLVLFMINGIAAAMPATLVMFFIRDVVQRPDAAAMLLGLYFVSGALSVPLWLRAVNRWGPSRVWAAGMVGNVLAFSGVLLVVPGSVGIYAGVCLLSGVMLGADLTAPGTLLNGVIQRSESLPAAGLFNGWWQMATKLNLALAAGVALPALQLLGYRAGVSDAASQQALIWMYGVVPCVCKALALCWWWRVWLKHEWE